MKNWKPYMAALTLAVLVLSLGGCGKSKQLFKEDLHQLHGSIFFVSDLRRGVIPDQ